MKFEFLDHNQTETIHLASLNILENAGATFLSARAQRVLGDAGAIVNSLNGNVRIPASLVKESLKKCPGTFRLYARNPKQDLQIGGSNQYMTCGGEYPYILDLESGARRLALSSDLVPLIKVTDALDNISVVAAT